MTNNNEVATLQGSSLTANPFGSAGAPAPVAAGGNAMMTAEMQRQVAEIQAQFMMALHRPRTPQIAVDKMLLECQRPALAEVAIYSFSRGGTAITGLSIRALEMVSRNWGNIKYGFRCLERRKGVSLLQAYAYDLESNVPVERVFEVRHVRDTKQGQKPITDERDIYELEANQAQRRVRACLEALIPGDVLDACEDAFKLTLESRADTSPDGIKKMLEMFGKFGVNQKMVEARIQRNVSSITAAQMVGLRAVYNSIKDGMSSIEQWFDMSLADSSGKPDTANDANASLKEQIKANAPQQSDKAPEQQTGEVEVNYFDDIQKKLKNAKTIQEADDVWNNNADIIKTLPDVQAKTLDKIYLSQRETVKNAQPSENIGKLV